MVHTSFVYTAVVNVANCQSQRVSVPWHSLEFQCINNSCDISLETCLVLIISSGFGSKEQLRWTYNKYCGRKRCAICSELCWVRLRGMVTCSSIQPHASGFFRSRWFTRVPFSRWKTVSPSVYSDGMRRHEIWCILSLSEHKFLPNFLVCLWRNSLTPPPRPIIEAPSLGLTSLATVISSLHLKDALALFPPGRKCSWKSLEIGKCWFVTMSELWEHIGNTREREEMLRLLVRYNRRQWTFPRSHKNPPVPIHHNRVSRHIPSRTPLLS